MTEKVNKRGDRRGLSEHKRNITAITSNNERYSQEVDSYKAFAEARRKMRKYDQVSVGRIYDQISAYVLDCYKKKEPLTIAGSMLASGTNKDIWEKARNGDLDYLLDEYITINNVTDDLIYCDDNGLKWFDDPENGPVLLLQWSDLAEKRDLMIQEQLEKNCYTNRGNPAGSIFGLKAKFNWREDDTAQHVVNQLVIADLEQAKKALQMLK